MPDVVQVLLTIPEHPSSPQALVSLVDITLHIPDQPCQWDLQMRIPGSKVNPKQKEEHTDRHVHDIQ